ncbi:hypothetical protein HYV81_00795 [Candidatus Woesearchaeota archaeon]|nr:hypothetical protein [Candidatus Woesearchaeota archaeon]
MMFEIRTTKFLLEQVKDYDEKTKRIIFDKKELLKINPFRYKKVNTESYSHVFSIKLSHKAEAKRLVYIVLGNIVFLCFILDRSRGYKDLERYFRRIEKELR